MAFVLISGAAAQSTIKIGVVQPLTGAFAAAGTDVTNGAKIAADEINTKGGVIGRKLELIIEDTKSNPTEAASATEKLIVRDKVPVLMGASASTATLAVMPKLMEYKVPMLVETSSSSKITTAGNPYVFRIAPPSEVEAEVFGKIVAKLGIKKADFLVVNNDWGRGTADEFSKVLKDHGIAVGLTERMDQGAQDMSAQLAKIKGSGADTLFVTTAVEQLSLVLKQAAALGLNVPYHHHRWIAKPRSAHHERRQGRGRQLASGLLCSLVAAGRTQSGRRAGIRRRVEKAGVAVREPDLELPRLRWHPRYCRSHQDRRQGRAGGHSRRVLEVNILGLNGTIKFEKHGPKGKESGQSMPNVYLVKIESGKVTVPKI